MDVMPANNPILSSFLSRRKAVRLPECTCWKEICTDLRHYASLSHWIGPPKLNSARVLSIAEDRDDRPHLSNLQEHKMAKFSRIWISSCPRPGAVDLNFLKFEIAVTAAPSNFSCGKMNF